MGGLGRVEAKREGTNEGTNEMYWVSGSVGRKPEDADRH